MKAQSKSSANVGSAPMSPSAGGRSEGNGVGNAELVARMKARMEAPASGAAPSGAASGGEFSGGLAAEGRSQTGGTAGTLGRRGSDTKGGPVKEDHTDEGVGAETGAGRNGHLDEWLTESHSVVQSGSDFVVNLVAVDVHTKVFVWPEGTVGRWSDIADFADHYGGPYDAGFNLYEGTLRHERQHAVEAVNAYNAHVGAFRAAVAAIKAASAADAEAAYQAAWTTFRTNYDAAYWANGEADGYRVEWEYYHQEYDRFLADPLSYGIVDWAVTEGDARSVLEMLDRIDKNGNAGGFDAAVRGLKDAGLLARLEENVSGADAWVYSALITKIKAV